MEEYTMAYIYATEVYMRRDVKGIMEKVFGGKKKSDGITKGDLDLQIEHPDIIEYIRENTQVPQPIKLIRGDDK